MEKKDLHAYAPFKGRSFLKLLDYSAEEIEALIDLAVTLKEEKKAGVSHRLHEGKNIALIFEKASTRTRCSFEVAASDLGARSTYLEPGSFQDLMTIREQFGALRGMKLVFFGDARYNMGNSLMVGCAKMGLHFTACAPEGFFPEKALVNKCKAIAAGSGGSVSLKSDPEKAAEGAQVLVTDVWVSMGEPAEAWAERIEKMLPYRVTQKLMDIAGPECRFMHCLPSFHDLNTQIGKEIHAAYGLDCMEVEDAVFEGTRSIVFDEAENRMHTIKAVLAATL